MRGRLKDIRRKSGLFREATGKLPGPKATPVTRAAGLEVCLKEEESDKKMKLGEEQSDDEEGRFAYEMHAKALQKEFKKEVPDKAVVDVLMDVTFHKRRKEISCSKKTVGTIAAKFPFLTSREQVWLFAHCNMLHHPSCCLS